MKIVRKKDTLLSKKIVDMWAAITVVLALAAFFTGKTDFKSFFENVSISSYLISVVKTISAYATALAVILFSFLGLLDFILLVFGLKYPIINFLWGYMFKSIVVVWWWQSTTSENLFLAILTLYFLSSYEFETKTKLISFFYKKTGDRINGFSVGLLFNDMKRNIEGVFIGLIMIRYKNHNTEHQTHNKRKKDDGKH